MFTLVTLNHISVCIGHKPGAQQLNFPIREMLRSATAPLHSWKPNKFFLSEALQQVGSHFGLVEFYVLKGYYLPMQRVEQKLWYTHHNRSSHFVAELEERAKQNVGQRLLRLLAS